MIKGEGVCLAESEGSKNQVGMFFEAIDDGRQRSLRVLPLGEGFDSVEGLLSISKSGAFGEARKVIAMKKGQRTP